MKMFYEEDVLDLEYRMNIIKEIRQPENVQRKREYLKRYEIYKDQTRKYVEESLRNEGLKEETIYQMINRGANLSILKKVINKKARVFLNPPTRNVGDSEDETNNLHNMLEELKFNEKMRKSDRYRELHKNNFPMIVPAKDQPSKDDPELQKLVMHVLNPWQYDVIEDSVDREKMRCIVISDFYQRSDQQVTAASESEAGVHRRDLRPQYSNRNDENIADNPADSGQGDKEEYIWWTDRYHFTTDGKGEIIAAKSPDDNRNPIGLIPGANNSEDQDGQFWALGGEDLVAGSVLINKLLTDLYYIIYLQGFGQIIVTGQNVARERWVFGPNNVISIDYDQEAGEPKPEISILSNNPPVQDWLNAMEQYLAMLLTTNNMSPSQVAAKLDVQSFPSGVAMLIEQSEVVEDITEKQTDYFEIERRLVDILGRWTRIYSQTNEFNDTWAGFEPLSEDVSDSYYVKYQDPKPPTSEREHLENLKLRKDLGLNELVDLLRRDNPDMSEEQAQEKLQKIREESMARLSGALSSAIASTQDESPGGSADDSEDEEENEDGES